MKSRLLSFLFVCLCAIPLLIINNSCKRCKKTSLPKEIVDNYPNQDDLSWIVFTDNDTLIYKNNLGDFDTVIVKIDPDYSNGGSYFPSGEYNSCETYSINWKKLMGFYLATSDTQIRFIVFKTPNSTNNQPPVIAAYNFLISRDYYLSNNLPITILTQNGMNYGSVYEIAGDSTATTQNNIWRFFYQKENGLLRFDQIGGIYWEKIN